jgi:hypothetical protein
MARALPGRRSEDRGDSLLKNIEYEPTASRTLAAQDDETVIACCGDGSPVRVTLPADIPGGVIVDILQWPRKAVSSAGSGSVWWRHSRRHT